MLDFKELKKDGTDLELLVREILLVKGFKVQWSGIGADGGKDLICFEERHSEFLHDKKTWLIQCKHKAHSIKKNAVGVTDLDNIVDSCAQHKAKGYLLVCSTYPSSAVINRLEDITNNSENDISATYWDAVILEQKLSNPSLWKIAQQFFPKSSKNSIWQIYATENPNQWIANFRGYHFHLSNRIGSNGDYHFKSINQRIDDIEKIKLPKDHFIRIRAIYFDDKNGNYTWFLDYMFPTNQKPVFSSYEIIARLGNGHALEDGQFYSFDVINRPYLEYSDHYDKDHYTYYEPYLHNFKMGTDRGLSESNRIIQYEIQEGEEIIRNVAFNRLINKFQSVDFIKIVNSVNCNIENIDKFVRLRDWSELVQQFKIETDHFFSAWLLIDIGTKENEFIKLISYLPLRSDCYFRLTKVYVHEPKINGEGCVYDKEESSLFELSIYINPVVISSKVIGRKYINAYFDELNSSIEKFQVDHKTSD